MANILNRIEEHRTRQINEYTSEAKQNNYRKNANGVEDSNDIRLNGYLEKVFSENEDKPGFRLAHQIHDKHTDPMKMDETDRRQAISGQATAYQDAIDDNQIRNKGEKEKIAEKLADSALKHSKDKLDEYQNMDNKLDYQKIEKWLSENNIKFVPMEDGTLVFKLKNDKQRKELEKELEGTGLEARDSTREEINAYRNKPAAEPVKKEESYQTVGPEGELGESFDFRKEIEKRLDKHEEIAKEYAKILMVDNRASDIMHEAQVEALHKLMLEADKNAFGKGSEQKAAEDADAASYQPEKAKTDSERAEQWIADFRNGEKTQVKAQVEDMVETWFKEGKEKIEVGDHGFILDLAKEYQVKSVMQAIESGTPSLTEAEIGLGRDKAVEMFEKWHEPFQKITVETDSGIHEVPDVKDRVKEQYGQTEGRWVINDLNDFGEVRSIYDHLKETVNDYENAGDDFRDRNGLKFQAIKESVERLGPEMQEMQRQVNRTKPEDVNKLINAIRDRVWDTAVLMNQPQEEAAPQLQPVGV